MPFDRFGLKEEETLEICDKYNMELRQPRLTSKQTQRSHVQTDSIEDIYSVHQFVSEIFTGSIF